MKKNKKKNIKNAKKREKALKESYTLENLSELKNELPEGKEDTSYPIEIPKTFKESEEAHKKEVWKPLFGYEITHRISSMGRLKSIDHYITDRNGNNRLVRGKMYNIKDTDEYYKFKLEGKLVSLVLVEAIGKSFYGEGEYSLINNYESFKKEGRTEMFMSLENIASNSNKHRITMLNTESGEETFIQGSITSLIMFINRTFKTKISIEDFATAKNFEVDETFGLMIKGIKKLPNYEFIIRKGLAYDKLLVAKRKYDFLKEGHILDEENLGVFYTPEEIRFGLTQLIESSEIDVDLKRYARATFKTYFESQFALSDLERYLIVCHKHRFVQKDYVRDVKKYKIYSLSSMSRFEVIHYELPAETLKIIEKKREDNVKIYGENYRRIKRKTSFRIKREETTEVKPNPELVKANRKIVESYEEAFKEKVTESYKKPYNKSYKKPYNKKGYNKKTSYKNNKKGRA